MNSMTITTMIHAFLGQSIADFTQGVFCERRFLIEFGGYMRLLSQAYDNCFVNETECQALRKDMSSVKSFLT